MKLTKQETLNTTILSVQGELDNYNNAELKKTIEQFASQNNYYVIVSLQKVNYMEAVVAKTLWEIAQFLQQQKGGLFLVAVRSSVQEVFQENISLDFNQIKEIFFDSVEQALEFAK